MPNPHPCPCPILIHVLALSLSLPHTHSCPCLILFLVLSSYLPLPHHCLIHLQLGNDISLLSENLKKDLKSGPEDPEVHMKTPEIIKRWGYEMHAMSI